MPKGIYDRSKLTYDWRKKRKKEEEDDLANGIVLSRKDRLALRKAIDRKAKAKTWTYAGEKRGRKPMMKKSHLRKIAKQKPSEITKIKKIAIDLSGPDGNAFYLLGLAKTWCIQLDLNYGAIYKEMSESDYANLCKVFEKHFGMFATLY